MGVADEIRPVVFRLKVMFSMMVANGTIEYELF